MKQRSEADTACTSAPDRVEDLARAGWTVHRPRRPFGLADLRQLLERRELLFFLAWRDYKVRHKQLLLGIGWTVLQPVIQMALFSLILGRFARLPSEAGLPYPILVFSGLLAWHYFSSSVGRCALSLVTSQALLSKVAFPRVVLPAAAVLPGLVDFLAALGVLAALMLWYGIAPRWTVIFLPAFLGLVLLTAFAVGLWMSALGVRYRDVRFLFPFVLQAWMLATPVGYSVEIVPAGWVRTLYELNPLAVVVKGFRWALFGTTPPGAEHLGAALAVAVVLVAGLAYFRRVDRTLADML